MVGSGLVGAIGRWRRGPPPHNTTPSWKLRWGSPPALSVCGWGSADAGAYAARGRADDAGTVSAGAGVCCRHCAGIVRLPFSRSIRDSVGTPSPAHTHPPAAAALDPVTSWRRLGVVSSEAVFN